MNQNYSRVSYSSYNSAQYRFNINHLSFSGAYIRHAFIKKVYSILAFQLSITIAITALFMSFGTIQFFKENIWIFRLISMAFKLLVFFCDPELQKHPRNIILLSTSTILDTIQMNSILLLHKLDEVLIIAGITAVIVLGITIVTFQTEIDLTGRGTVLFLSIASLIIMVFNLICHILAVKGKLG